VFDWLFEGRVSVYILLATAAAALLYTGLQWRKRSLLVAGGIVAALISVYFLLDRLVETGREQARRKLHEIAEAVKARDADRILGHVSERFSSQGRDHAALRGYVEARLRDRLIDELVIWDITFPDSPAAAADGELRVAFRARPHGARLGTTPPFLVEATFCRDADGEWRITAFLVFNPIVDSHTPLDLP
jgi:hypothetical protein